MRWLQCDNNETPHDANVRVTIDRDCEWRGKRIKKRKEKSEIYRSFGCFACWRNVTNTSVLLFL